MKSSKDRDRVFIIVTYEPFRGWDWNKADFFSLILTPGLVTHFPKKSTPFSSTCIISVKMEVRGPSIGVKEAEGALIEEGPEMVNSAHHDKRLFVPTVAVNCMGKLEVTND